MDSIRKYINIFLLVLFVYLICTYNFIGGSEFVFHLASLFVVFLVMNSQFCKGVTIYAISIIYLIIGVYQPIDSMVHIDFYANSIRTNASIIANPSLRIQYCIYSAVFYALSVLVIWFAQKMPAISISIQLKKEQVYELEKYGNIYLVALVWGAIRLIVQMRFHLLYAGQDATIAHSGILVYLIRIISLIIWAQLNEYIIKISEGNVKKYIIRAIVLAVICGAPQAYLGTRSEILVYLLNAIIILLINYSNDKFNVALIGKALLLVFIIGLVSIGIAYYFRTGASTSVFSFLRERFVGFVDGLNVIRYLNDGGECLPVKNFFMGLLSMDGTIYLTSFYTHGICGYPNNLVHSWSIPCFASGLLYGKIPGMIIFSILSVTACVIVEKFVVNNFLRKNYFRSICFLFLYVELLFNGLMEGSIDKAGNFIIITIASLIIDDVFKFRFKLPKVEKD